jgi:serine/threonine-protein kinase
MLVPSGINGPSGVAVDEQGNVYFSDAGNNAVKQWNAASQHVVTLVSSGLNHPAGVAVDAQLDLLPTPANLPEMA